MDVEERVKRIRGNPALYQPFNKVPEAEAWLQIFNDFANGRDFEHEGDIEKASWMLVLSLERAYYTASFEAGSLSDMPFRTIERTMADICAEASVSPTAMLASYIEPQKAASPQPF